MQFCNMGSLASAIEQGWFHDADGEPKLVCACLCACCWCHTWLGRPTHGVVSADLHAPARSATSWPRRATLQQGWTACMLRLIGSSTAT